MPKREDSVRLTLDQRLRESPRQATSMTLPLAVHHRLDLLAEIAEDVQATRGEIIGMLIADAYFDSETLERQVMAYRKKLVRDVVPGQHESGSDSNVVSIVRRPPGRPGRRRAQQ